MGNELTIPTPSAHYGSIFETAIIDPTRSVEIIVPLNLIRRRVWILADISGGGVAPFWHGSLLFKNGGGTTLEIPHRWSGNPGDLLTHGGSQTFADPTSNTLFFNPNIGNSVIIPPFEVDCLCNKISLVPADVAFAGGSTRFVLACLSQSLN